MSLAALKYLANFARSSKSSMPLNLLVGEVNGFTVNLRAIPDEHRNLLQRHKDDEDLTQILGTGSGQNPHSPHRPAIWHHAFPIIVHNQRKVCGNYPRSNFSRRELHPLSNEAPGSVMSSPPTSAHSSVGFSYKYSS